MHIKGIFQGIPKLGHLLKDSSLLVLQQCVTAPLLGSLNIWTTVPPSKCLTEQCADY
jgi:hypothetical protein